jgi:hypothetical protein
MAEDKIENRTETGDEFSERVMGEIGSLREEITAIRQLMEREHSLDKAVKEYRVLSSSVEKPIRWGFIGAWGKGGSSCAISVHSTTEDDYFDSPDAGDEGVAAFASAFADLNTIKICKHIFREGGRSREEIKKACNLSDEELDAAVKPMIEWYFAEWKDGKLETSGPGLNGQGVNYAVTLISMAKVAVDSREHRGNSVKYP